ncbi:MAG: diguanylate cyclase, partial [Oscillospiraceae bacterium]
NQCNVVSAKELAQKIKDSVGIKEFMSTSKEEVVNITLSIGINSEQTRHCDICELVDKADKAMFEAKRQGKDTISIAGSKPS